ncbi:uncharacterized protein LOC114262708 [Camellia sinensis]|uniref:uncharacterized protein LOC114262708 n=1 Tax=Camellia sinensis TaxID=4442 RepID=UPI0010367177|nr:uncharacterized protein LOC114262708 [Camellia sinensis]
MTWQQCSLESVSMPEVLNGKIMIISSGQLDAITRARPILSAMSEKLYVFEGALGAGRKQHLNQWLTELTNNETLSLQHQVQAVAPLVLQQYFLIQFRRCCLMFLWPSPH